MRVLLIHNPKAGYEQADGPRLMELIHAAGHEPVYQSSEVDDLGAAMEQGVDLVAVAGGDGTVTRVLKRAVGLRTPLAILPLGTANNVANAIGHAGTLEHLIQGWASATPRPMDLGVVEAEWGQARFAESFGVGFLAETIVQTDKGDAERARTKFKSVTERLNATVKSLRKSLQNLKPRPLRARTSAGVLEGEFLWAEASTVGLVGARLPLTDAADVSDGLLTFAALPADERETFLEYLDHRLAGSAPTRTGFISERVAEIELEWDGFHTHLDGSLVSDLFDGFTTRARISTIPAAASVLRFARPG